MLPLSLALTNFPAKFLTFVGSLSNGLFVLSAALPKPEIVDLSVFIPFVNGDNTELLSKLVTLVLILLQILLNVTPLPKPIAVIWPAQSVLPEGEWISKADLILSNTPVPSLAAIFITDGKEDLIPLIIPALTFMPICWPLFLILAAPILRVDTIKLIPLEINTAALLTAVPKIVIPVAKTLNAPPANNIPGLAAPNTKPAAPISANGPGICDIFPTLESSISPFANGDIYNAAPAKPRAPKVNVIPAKPRRDNPPARGTKPFPISAKGNPANITSDGVNICIPLAAAIIARPTKSSATAKPTNTIAPIADIENVAPKINIAAAIAAITAPAFPSVSHLTNCIFWNAYAKAIIAPDTINIDPAPAKLLSPLPERIDKAVATANKVKLIAPAALNIDNQSYLANNEIEYAIGINVVDAIANVANWLKLILPAVETIANAPANANKVTDTAAPAAAILDHSPACATAPNARPIGINTNEAFKKFTILSFLIFFIEETIAIVPPNANSTPPIEPAAAINEPNSQ